MPTDNMVNGKKVKWITLENGVHIPVVEGSDVIAGGLNNEFTGQSLSDLGDKTEASETAVQRAVRSLPSMLHDLSRECSAFYEAADRVRPRPTYAPEFKVDLKERFPELHSALIDMKRGMQDKEERLGLSDFFDAFHYLLCHVVWGADFSVHSFEWEPKLWTTEGEKYKVYKEASDELHATIEAQARKADPQNFMDLCMFQTEIKGLVVECKKQAFEGVKKAYDDAVEVLKKHGLPYTEPPRLGGYCPTPLDGYNRLLPSGQTLDFKHYEDYVDRYLLKLLNPEVIKALGAYHSAYSSLDRVYSYGIFDRVSESVKKTMIGMARKQVNLQAKKDFEEQGDAASEWAKQASQTTPAYYRKARRATLVSADFFSRDDVKGLRGYAGNRDYFGINHYLRFGTFVSRRKNKPLTEKDTQRMQTTITRLRAALDKCSVKAPYVAFRGLRNYKAEIKVGQELTDKGFMSTSIDFEFSSNWLKKYASEDHKPVVIELHVPKGAKAVYASDIAHNQHEHEIVMQQGTKYRIKSVKEKGGVRYCVAEVILPSEDKDVTEDSAWRPFFYDAWCWGVNGLLDRWCIK